MFTTGARRVIDGTQDTTIPQRFTDETATGSKEQRNIVVDSVSKKSMYTPFW